MAIEWYPGHMTRARREIAEAMNGIDVVIEVLDARLPYSSSNPVLETLRTNRPCIKVLNKHDLADPLTTKAWVSHFEQQSSVRALPLEAKERGAALNLLRECKSLAPHRGKPGKTLRAMVIGIPNVGKSTLINTLAGKRIARVGDKPAITTCRQQINLPGNITLADTPGLLWPVLSDQNGALRLAASGAIGDSAIDYVEVALFAIAFMQERYLQRLHETYPYTAGIDDPAALLLELGRRQGCLVGGGEVDLSRAGEFFLRALRSGKLGRISFEQPGDEIVAPPPVDEEGIDASSAL